MRATTHGVASMTLHKYLLDSFNFVYIFLIKIDQIVKESIHSSSGCDTGGRAVASNTREPWFGSSKLQFLMSIYLLLNVKKGQIIKKRGPNGPFKKRHKCVP